MFFPCIFPCKLTLRFSQERVLKLKSWRKQTSLKIQFYSNNCLKQDKNPKKLHMTRSIGHPSSSTQLQSSSSVVLLLSVKFIVSRPECPVHMLSLFENMHLSFNYEYYVYMMFIYEQVIGTSEGSTDILTSWGSVTDYQSLFKEVWCHLDITIDDRGGLSWPIVRTLILTSFH